ncbi:DinB family protein [Aurantimonas sp. A2-1-M11]|uniref:DinB family protein n=1 Tax=Aurantimonas sp. A2-1-M11 TaxID=3113712 RepID=UPI002F92CA25
MLSTNTARVFAGYNRWCNERLYVAAAGLTEKEVRADLGVFFRSMLGTLNHILVAVRIWMRRFTGSGDGPDRLDAILFPDLTGLQLARQAEDARIIGWVDGLADTDLADDFTYRTISGTQEFTQVLGGALLNMLNHQTHHRGQAHAILTGFARDAPSFDLIAFQREAGRG